MPSTTPKGLAIRPRQLDAALPEQMPRHWHAGDAFKTHLFNAMSVLFPDGERFFIDSVRLFREQIDDPLLQEQIRGFIGQEGHHSREHQQYSQRLRALGYDVDYLERGLKRRLGIVQKHLSPELQLAATCAVEHLTAIMADAVLKDPQWLTGADPQMARLWRWHALEETEHKAVAFDVFMQVSGSTWLRRRAMLQSTFFFTLDTIKGLVHMLKHDGLLWNWRVWRDGLTWLWGKNGIYRKLIPVYCDFYRSAFHPWQHDNLYLVDQYRQEFDAPAASV
ncbi:metal-dependent hydrolase [Pseudomonas sp. UBA2684]|uniref:metal-dependent hydrolase n=1 Tax=Pseudomonas sp. UBA2684 TaxID=1947311 RepID=UPI0025F456FE|nr:metal-dependent hydrolase [Pseudomonas sp. UBA2684]|tara:strand:+ start:5000 stop:5833 length:834 start_codon:yes stop_codon:yes gene_type:complete